MKLLTFQFIRGFAFLLIFLSHSFSSLGHWGAAGVSFFIILSGFLESMKYSNYSTIPGGGLALNKIYKIYSLHLLMLLISLPLSYHFLKSSGILKYLISLMANAIMVQSWIPLKPIYFSFNGVAWYLTLVVFFAAITPKIITYAVKIKKIYFTIVGLILLEFCWCTLCKDSEINHWLIYIFPIARLIDYSLGIFTWLLVSKQDKVNYLSLTTAIIIEIIFLTTVIFTRNEYFLSFLWAVPSIIIIGEIYKIEVIVKRKAIYRVFTNKMMVLIGNISFELFLIHQLVIRYITAINSYFNLGVNLVIKVLISFIISFCCSYLFHYRKKYLYLLKNNNH